MKSSLRPESVLGSTEGTGTRGGNPKRSDPTIATGGKGTGKRGGNPKRSDPTIETSGKGSGKLETTGGTTTAAAPPRRQLRRVWSDFATSQPREGQRMICNTCYRWVQDTGSDAQECNCGSISVSHDPVTFNVPGATGWDSWAAVCSRCNVVAKSAPWHPRCRKCGSENFRFVATKTSSSWQRA